MKEIYSDYLKFVDDALELAKAIPKYFSKFSNKIYCNHQKLAIYVLMQKFKTTTRGIISILRASSDIRLKLGLTRVPVHTTIVRFANKVRKQITKLLGIRQAVNVAVDATGFELESKSFYYRNIVNPICNRRKKTKKFMKLNLSVDTDKQMILTYKIRKSRVHESKDFEFLLKELNVDYVMADKGYSSKKNRRFVINKLKAIPVIPKKKSERNTYVSLGKKLKFEDKKYHQRSKVETIFFVIKKKYGSVLRNRTYTTQKVELISKLIAYNLDRTQLISLFIQRVAPAP
jgi:IS5 family transposase